jgi:ribosomal protein S20
MPNKKSAIKHLKQTVKLTRANALVKRNIKEIIKQGEKSVTKGDINDRANELAYSLQKAIDKAVKSGILKPNTGNRKKARFMAMLKKAGVKTDSTKAPAKQEDKK